MVKVLFGVINGHLGEAQLELSRVRRAAVIQLSVYFDTN